MNVQGTINSWAVYFSLWRRLSGLIALLLVLGACCDGCAVVPPGSHLPPDHWFGKDKLEHFAVSAAMAAAVTNYKQNHGSDGCEAERLGFSISVAVGAGKETYDKYVRHTYWSLKDFAWDVLGSSVGTLIAGDC